jgi:hypothetical protein
LVSRGALRTPSHLKGLALENNPILLTAGKIHGDFAVFQAIEKLSHLNNGEISAVPVPVPELHEKAPVSLPALL